MTNELAVWDETPLGTLCKENGGSIQTGPFGSQLHAEDYKEQGVPIITVEHLGDGSILHRNLPLVGVDDYRRLARYVLKTGDLVFSRVGAIDRCARVSEQEDGWLFSGRCLRVRLGSGSTDSKYMSFVLNSHEARQWILNHAVGSTMACLNTSILSNVPLRLASPPEQRKIALILTTLDNLIEKTEALIAKYQAIKQGMMHDLFTRGVDSSGQLRPTQEQAPDLYKQSELGWIPKEWEPSTVGKELHSIDAGKSPNCPDQPAPDGEWGVLKVSAVQPDGFRPDENKIIVDRIHINPAYEVQSGDLLLSRSNTYQLVGIVSLVAETRSLLMLCDKTLRLRFNQSQAKTAFMFWQLQQPAVRRQIEIYATGTSGSMKNISQPSIRGLKFARPSVEEQEIIANRIFAVQRRIRSETIQNEKLRKLKSGLMQDLLTGKVRVKVDEAEEVAAHA